MNDEAIEIRRLIAKIENQLYSGSANAELCQRAELARFIIHEPLYSVVLGIEEIEKLLQDMAKENGRIHAEAQRELAKFQKELAAFKKNSNAWKSFRSGGKRNTFENDFINRTPCFDLGSYQSTKLFDMATSEDLARAAQDILGILQREWTIGPYFVPLSPSNKIPERLDDLNIAFSGLSGLAYQHFLQCIQILSRGREDRNTLDIVDKYTYTFDLFRAASQLALEIKDAWTPSLILVSIVAAHELRPTNLLGVRIGSTGMHGPDRLKAKLTVGKLIGDLSQYSLDDALTLADLTIESTTFSRSQVLYAHEHNPEALARLIERWHLEKHPLDRDIVAQAHLFRGEKAQANEILRAAKHDLQTAQSRRLLSGRGEYFVKRDFEHMDDIYLARLSRTLALFDPEEALQWCDEITTPVIHNSIVLHIFQNNPSINSMTNIKSELWQVVADPGFVVTDFWMPAYELHHLPFLRVYPEFPAERWGDLSKDHLTVRREISGLLLESSQ